MLRKICGVLTLVCCLAGIVTAQTYYVKPGAKGNGSVGNPIGDIQKALDLASKSSSKMKNDITIYLRGGEYEINEPILITSKHSGKNGNRIIVKAYEGEDPIISGGVHVQNWQHVEGNIYKAKLDRDSKLRALYVNGKRKRMAGTDVPVKGLGNWGKFVVNGDEPWAYGAGEGIDGIKFSAKEIGRFASPQDIELVQFNIWTEKILCAREIECDEDTCIIKLQQPYGAIATNMAWAGKINYNKAFVIRNAKELMDAPGEFYFDRRAGELFYFSEGENMEEAIVIAPTTEGLIEIKGESVFNRVENIRFEGITFSYDDWQLMNVDGSSAFAGIQSLGLAVKFVPGGNWHPTKYNSTDVPNGTIQVSNAKGIEFVRNRFVGNTSAININLINDVVSTRVVGNYFNDLLGNAINVGHPQHYEIGDEDKFAKGQEGVCRDINISNNYLRNVCLDYRQVEGITGFFAENIAITHNDIRNTPYGAISFGWWWGNSGIPASTVSKNNIISYNRAGDSHKVLDDGGIIYVLGEQPNSKMTNNYVFNGPRCLYPDDGSAYWTITDNVVMNPNYKLWLHLWTKRCHDIVAYRNYVKNNMYLDNGVDNIISNNYSFREEEFSEAAQRIIDQSGLEDDYKDIIPSDEPDIISIHPTEFKERDRFH